jgi:hypothetical protein
MLPVELFGLRGRCGIVLLVENSRIPCQESRAADDTTFGEPVQ